MTLDLVLSNKGPICEAILSQDDEFWHRLECLGEPGGRSAGGCVQSDKQGRVCNGSFSLFFSNFERDGVGLSFEAFSASFACCSSFPTSGTGGPPATKSANKRECSNHSCKRKLAPFFPVLFFASADSPRAWAGLGASDFERNKSHPTRKKQLTWALSQGAVRHVHCWFRRIYDRRF
jgi:hypothetical protein